MAGELLGELSVLYGLALLEVTSASQTFDLTVESKGGQGWSGWC